MAEGDADAGPDVRFSADRDAIWVKKGRKSTLGYKGFARSDEEGFIEKVHVTPANAGESPEFGTMIDGARARRVLADKAYASRANRDRLVGKHRDGIMRKAARGRPLRASEKRFNRLVSKCRFRIEQCFGTMKRLFGLAELWPKMGDSGLRRRRIVAGVRSLPEPPEGAIRHEGRYHDHPVSPARFDR